MIKNTLMILFFLSPVFGKTTHYFTGSYAQEFSSYVEPFARMSAADLQNKLSAQPVRTAISDPVNITLMFQISYSAKTSDSSSFSFVGSSSSGSVLTVTTSRRDLQERNYQKIFNQLDASIVRLLLQFSKNMDDKTERSVVWDVDWVLDPQKMQNARQQQLNRVNAKMNAMSSATKNTLSAL